MDRDGSVPAGVGEAVGVGVGVAGRGVAVGVGVGVGVGVDGRTLEVGVGVGVAGVGVGVGVGVAPGERLETGVGDGDGDAVGTGATAVDVPPDPLQAGTAANAVTAKKPPIRVPVQIFKLAISLRRALRSGPPSERDARETPKRAAASSLSGFAQCFLRSDSRATGFSES